MSKRVAILATNGFEESELKSPKEYLEAQGLIVKDGLANAKVPVEN